MNFDFEIGLNVISSYRRLAYTPWHAIAEFIDNATQNYINHRAELDASYASEGGDTLDIGVVYDRTAGSLSVADNALGMDLDELRRALRVAFPPADPTGRSKYGLGMKTAACWIGNKWTIRTTKLGVPKEYVVTVDVHKIESGDPKLDVQEKDAPTERHYSILEIEDLNKQFHTRTISKIRKYLESMYRKDFIDLGLKLRWQSQVLGWTGFEGQLLQDKQGKPCHKPFEFEVDGHKVTGWGGILATGARSNAGFSMLQNRRVIRGWPDAWRPVAIYGDARNDLINQRLVGEINVDGFDVSHTKDDILWKGDQEHEVEKALKGSLSNLVSEAREYRKKGALSAGGPSDGDVDKAVSTFSQELQSDEMVERVEFEDIPDEEMLRVSLRHIADQVKEHEKPTISAKLGRLTVTVYIVRDLSPMDPYVVLDSAVVENVIVIINFNHPYVKTQVEGEDGVLNYLRHCIYDAVAESKARLLTREINPDTVKMIKDQLLRVSFQMIQDEPSALDDEVDLEEEADNGEE